MMLQLAMLALMLAQKPPLIEVKVSEPMLFMATGYCPCSKCNGPYVNTALGTEIKPGVVAVDPRVIPLESWLYVEGYGVCQAMDVGGAIKGYRIDIAHSSHSEAMAHGKTERKVWVLSETQ